MLAAFMVLASISPMAMADSLDSVTQAPVPAPANLETIIPTTTITTATDAELVAADKEALVDSMIQGLNLDLNNVTTSLTNPLPSIGPNGSTITWASSDYTVVSNDGQTVIRPAYLAGDVTVPMFATIKKGPVTDIKVFTLKVLQSPSSVASVSSAGLYIVSADGTSSETISNVPFATSKANFLLNIAKDEPTQTLVDTGLQDPVVTGNTLIVTAQDGTTSITYTVKTLDAPKKATPAKAQKPLPKKIAEPFTDSEKHWANEYIENMRLKGIIMGLGNSNFGPDLQITRGELVKIAMTYYKKPLPKRLQKKSFSDVAITDQYAFYIEAAKNAHFIKGFKDGTFKPNEMISRGDALKILLLASDTRITKAPDAEFTDEDYNDRYDKYINFAKEKDVVIGYEDGTFRPNQMITRAEFLKIISLIRKLK
ncbi:MAG: S-layer homology domain-containing protein [Candidatus Levybacteria bacterium]|nr:S-layer homology domain-containing protein [Candidatus Levybacteria bacterium]